MTANGNPQLNFNSPNPDVMNAFLAQFTQQGVYRVVYRFQLYLHRKKQQLPLLLVPMEETKKMMKMPRFNESR